MSFNPATFLDTTHASARTVQRLGHCDDIDHQPRVPVAAVLRPIANWKPEPTKAQAENRRFIDELRLAAARFDSRRDHFAEGKGETCRDLADKLEHFGGWASDRQAEFAYKLVGWSAGYGKPHPMEATQEPAQAAPGAPIATPVVPVPAPAPETRLDRLFDLMQRLSKLTIGELTIARKNQDSLCWVKIAAREGVVGKIDGGKLTIFTSRLASPLIADLLLSKLLKIEADPQAAAVLHGKLSGRCSICSRDLTDPVSIARGIGPICIGKAGW